MEPDFWNDITHLISEYQKASVRILIAKHRNVENLESVVANLEEEKNDLKKRLKKYIHEEYLQ